MKKRMLFKCVFAISICGLLVSCNNGLGEYVYIDGSKTLHMDKKCRSIAVFRKASPVSLHKSSSIIKGEWDYICPKCVSDKNYKMIERIGERNLKAYNNKRALFYSLSKDYDMGTLDQFLVDIEDEGKRRMLYDEIKDEYNLTSFAEFSLRLMGYDITANNDDEYTEEAEPEEEYDYEMEEDYYFGRVGH